MRSGGIFETSNIRNITLMSSTIKTRRLSGSALCRESTDPAFAAAAFPAAAAAAAACAGLRVSKCACIALRRAGAGVGRPHTLSRSVHVRRER